MLVPSWASAGNALLTLNGAWHKVRDDATLRFMMVAAVFYGLSTFEGSFMAIRTVNALSHYTDWTVGHVHAGALGWVAMITFGAIYSSVPWLWKRQRMYSARLVEVHFWLALAGTVIYVFAMWNSGIIQGLMWRTYNESGTLAYSFVDSLVAMHPYYIARAIGGLLFLIGALVALLQHLDDDTDGRTARRRAAWRPSRSRDRRRFRASTGGVKRHVQPALPARAQDHRPGAGHHRRCQPSAVRWRSYPCSRSTRPSKKPRTCAFTRRSRSQAATSIIREGCYACHSQMIRTLRDEVERYGPYSLAVESKYDHPMLWGSKRTGPDIARMGNKYSDEWHVRHLNNPRDVVPESVMPHYSWLGRTELRNEDLGVHLAALRKVGVPYTDDMIANAKSDAYGQATPDTTVRRRGDQALRCGDECARLRRQAGRTDRTRCAGRVPANSRQADRRRAQTSRAAGG